MHRFLISCLIILILLSLTAIIHEVIYKIMNAFIYARLFSSVDVHQQGLNYLFNYAQIINMEDEVWKVYGYVITSSYSNRINL